MDIETGCTQRTRNTSECPEIPDRTSSELNPDELRAMLSELSGTPLRGTGAWDAEASTRLAAFQRAEGLPATGSPDNVTVDRLCLRFEGVIAAHTDVPNRCPSPEAYARVSTFLQQSVNAADHVAGELAHDAPLRARYVAETHDFANQTLQRFARGEISEGEAAYAASAFRNQSLKTAREGMSPAGQALSRYLKEQGTTLPALVDKYAASMFAKPVKSLTVEEQGRLCLKIAEKSGMTNEGVNAAAKVAPAVGKVMLAAAIGIAIYQVATADDKVGEAVKQGASFAGAWAGAQLGIAAGVVCGPAAPVCSTVGGLIGAIAGSLIAEKAAEVTYSAIKG